MSKNDWEHQPRDVKGRFDEKDGKKSKPQSKTAVVVSIGLLATLMSAAGGADTAAALGEGFDAASNASGQIDSDVARSKQSAKKGGGTPTETEAVSQAEAKAWRKAGVQQVKKYVDQQLQCALQSYGQIQQFFIQNPCDNLHQALYVLPDLHGNTIIGKVSWIRMPSNETAEQFLKLENTYGTGDVTPFISQVLELDNIHFTGRYYQQKREGSLVIIAETEPLHGHPTAERLQQAADQAVTLPPS
ncbi:MAG TPA: hypothetical protein VF444_09690 [Pseudonocardiaceae bacterium]